MYEATIYEDDGNKGVTKRIITLKKGDHLALRLSPAGGQAVILRLTGLGQFAENR
jgi:hypothetical protein